MSAATDCLEAVINYSQALHRATSDIEILQMAVSAIVAENQRLHRELSELRAEATTPEAIRFHISMKLTFQPEDFALCKDELSQERMTQRAAQIANARLAEMLEGAPVVFSATPNRGRWDVEERASQFHTHRARLVNVEELGK
jgi:regulator of replication initiation timing